jgi:TetR/AcrR family transcriptional repressor of lmrAB and yxaGH operons
MPKTSTDTRSRLISTTKRLLWSQGYGATGMSQIITESRTPRGSVYFHFPGGKEELAVEALRNAGESLAASLRKSFDEAPCVGDALREFVESFARAMEQSSWRRGCPIATVTLEAAAVSEPIRQACDAAFAQWRGIIRDRLVRDGINPERAERLASFVLSSLEGALVLSRAAKDVAPLDAVADQLTALVQSSR